MFHLLLFAHIVTGVICLVSGLFAMFLKKKKGGHTLSGEIYHWSYVVVFITSISMAIIHWEESAYLFYIGVFSYSLALLGYLSGRVRWKNWLGTHIGSMLGSYIGIVTATIVVNIHKIPIVNELPILLFWFLPTVIGTPIIFIIGKKYSVIKR